MLKSKVKLSDVHPTLADAVGWIEYIRHSLNYKLLDSDGKSYIDAIHENVSRGYPVGDVVEWSKQWRNKSFDILSRVNPEHGRDVLKGLLFPLGVYSPEGINAYMTRLKIRGSFVAYFNGVITVHFEREGRGTKITPPRHLGSMRGLVAVLEDLAKRSNMQVWDVVDKIPLIFVDDGGAINRSRVGGE